VQREIRYALIGFDSDEYAKSACTLVTFRSTTLANFRASLGSWKNFRSAPL
jgi:hypothetical protein